MDSIKPFLEKCLRGEGITEDEALCLSSEQFNIYDLMYAANTIREKIFRNKIALCSIINAKSGLCSNDCSFCAQSSFYKTGVAKTETINQDKTLEASRISAGNRSSHFGLVTSGVRLDDSDLLRILKAAKRISEDNRIGLCASLGELDDKRACGLYNSRIRTYHHNLETSERFYPKICSTYDYKNKLQTIESAKRAGLRICSGGIFGLGETWIDRIDMAMAIRRLGASSIPINFLNPIKGTPLEMQPLIRPIEALRIIAVYRFIFPDKTIKICGGRERVLRDLQPMMFYAGANGIMTGNYLTTTGQPVEKDLQMLDDLELEPAIEGTSLNAES